MTIKAFFLIVFISCTSHLGYTQSIETQIKVIDSLPITSTFLEINTYYHDNKLNDTVAIIKIKRNNNGDLLYYEKQILPYSSEYAANLKKIPRDSMIIKKYYDLDIGLFYHYVLRKFPRWGMEYKCFKKEGKQVSHAQQIHFGSQDTVFIDFEYEFYPNGNRKTRTIHSKSNEPYYNISEITSYNQQGLETNTYTIIDNKKQLKRSCYYRKNKIYKAFEWETSEYKWEHHYDDNERVIYSKYYHNSKWIASKKYKYDNVGNILEIKSEDFDIVYQGEITKFVLVGN